MGLDVYLHHYNDFKKSKAVEMRYEVGSEAIWAKVGNGKKYEQLTKAEKDEASRQTAELALKLGLGVYGQDTLYSAAIRATSVVHPDHDGFEIGYFRSSYNDGGINRVLEKMGLPTLYDIFPHKDDEYEFSPDWKASLKLVNKALVAFNHSSNGFNGKYDCMDMSAQCLSTLVKDEKTALNIFKAEIENIERARTFKNYSNNKGHFFGDALTVRGFVPGIDVLGRPCVYVITERPKNNAGEDENLKWYREALEIVRETIEHVLAQKDPQNYYLQWSG